MPEFYVFALYFFFVVLQLADAWTTITIVRKGVGHEANPVMAWLIDKAGIYAAFLFKTVVVGAIGGGLAWYGYPISLAALIVLYLVVVINNLEVLHHARLP